MRSWFHQTYMYEDFNFETRKVLLSLHRRFSYRCEERSVGRTRVCYLMRTYVIKMPRCLNGMDDNDWEGSVSNLPNPDEEEIKYARTRLVYYQGIPLLFMERVQIPPGEDYKKFPVWIYSVDCQQVGYTKSGKLVAYDYGLW